MSAFSNILKENLFAMEGNYAKVYTRICALNGRLAHITIQAVAVGCTAPRDL